MYRAYTIPRSAVTGCLVLPASLFIGVMLQGTAAVIHAPAGFIAAPLLCADVAVETAAPSGVSRTGRRIIVSCGSGSDSDAAPVFSPLGMPVAAQPAEEDVTFQAWGASVFIYSAVVFILLQLLRRRRRQRATIGGVEFPHR